MEKQNRQSWNYIHKANARGAESIDIEVWDEGGGLTGARFTYTDSRDRQKEERIHVSVILSSVEEKVVAAAAEALRYQLKSRSISEAIVDGALLLYLDSKQEKLPF